MAEAAGMINLDVNLSLMSASTLSGLPCPKVHASLAACLIRRHAKGSRRGSAAPAAAAFGSTQGQGGAGRAPR